MGKTQSPDSMEHTMEASPVLVCNAALFQPPGSSNVVSNVAENATEMEETVDGLVAHDVAPGDTTADNTDNEETVVRKIEKIIGHKYVGDKLFYQVRWKDSWVLKNTLASTSLVRDYESKHDVTPKKNQIISKNGRKRLAGSIHGTPAKRPNFVEKLDNNDNEDSHDPDEELEFKQFDAKNLKNAKKSAAKIPTETSIETPIKSIKRCRILLKRDYLSKFTKSNERRDSSSRLLNTNRGGSSSTKGTKGTKGTKKVGASNKKREKENKRDNQDSDGSEPEYEVERIINARKTNGGKREFLVKWKGWTSRYNSWEPQEHLHCDELIKKFDSETLTRKTSSAKIMRITLKRKNVPKSKK